MLIILFWDKLFRLPMFQRTLKAISVQKTRLILLYHSMILPQKSFKVLKKTLGLINVRADEKEVFLNYGYDKEKSKILYAA